MILGGGIFIQGSDLSATARVVIPWAPFLTLLLKSAAVNGTPPIPREYI